MDSFNLKKIIELATKNNNILNNESDEKNNIKNNCFKRYCDNCGKELDEDSKFCPNCGHQVSNQSIPNINDAPHSQKDSNGLNDEVLVDSISSEIDDITDHQTIFDEEDNIDKLISGKELNQDLLKNIKQKIHNVSYFGKIPAIILLLVFVLCIIAFCMGRRIAGIFAFLQVLLLLVLFVLKVKFKDKIKNYLSNIIVGIVIVLLVPYILTYGIDYSSGHHFTWKEIMMLCQSFGEDRGLVSFSDTSVKNELYTDVLEQLDKAGFHSIEVVELKDLNEKNALNGFVESISINNIFHFEKDAIFPLSSKIIIKYHSYAEQSLPIVSNKAKGNDFNEIKLLFKNSMFFNIKEKLVDDADDNNINNHEIEYIEVNGNRDYTLEDLYAIDSKITLYHSYKKELLPINLNEVKGKSYEEVFKIFKKSNFFNIKSELIEDQEYDNILNDEMEYIKVDNISDILPETKIPLDRTITLYHSYKTDSMPILSEEAKGMEYSEIQNLFANTLFENVKHIADVEITELNQTDYSVEKILVNKRSDYKLEDRINYDEEILIYYKQKEYNVTIRLEGKKDAFFGKYDVQVLVDGKKIGTLPYGETKSFDISLLKGKYTLELISKKDDDISVKKEFNIKNNRVLRYIVSFRSDNIKVRYMKQLKAPYVNEEIQTMNVQDVEKKFRDIGFKKVKLVELSDLSYDSISNNNLCSQISINKNEIYTKNDSFYADSPVEIKYHSMKKALVPATNDLKKTDYLTVEQKFRDNGFVNVSSVIYSGEYPSSAINNHVHNVVINGDYFFVEGEEYPLDSKVEISYYAINYESVSAAKMMDDYEANAYNATQYYENRYISVTGIVHKIDGSGRKFALRESDNPYTFETLMCEISNKSQKDMIAQINAGDKITVNGKVTYVWGIYSEIYTVKIHDIIIN